MGAGIYRFGARWSLLTWAVTLLVIAVVIVVMGVALAHAARTPVLVVMAMIVPLALAVTALFAPLGYTVDAVGIMVNRMGSKICVLYDEIVEIRRVNRSDVGLSVRLLGSGGFLGFYGRFWSRRLGRHRAYVTSGRNLVLIECVDGEKVLISPYPADLFMELVAKVRPQTVGGENTPNVP